MVNPQAPFQHLLQPDDLGQAPVPALQPGHRLLHKDVDVSLFRCRRQVKAVEVVSGLVNTLAAEDEYHHWQELPAQMHDSVFSSGGLLLLQKRRECSDACCPILRRAN